MIVKIPGYLLLGRFKILLKRLITVQHLQMASLLPRWGGYSLGLLSSQLAYFCQKRIFNKTVLNIENNLNADLKATGFPDQVVHVHISYCVHDGNIQRPLDILARLTYFIFYDVPKSNSGDSNQNVGKSYVRGNIIVKILGQVHLGRLGYLKEYRVLHDHLISPSQAMVLPPFPVPQCRR